MAPAVRPYTFCEQILPFSNWEETKVPFFQWISWLFEDRGTFLRLTTSHCKSYDFFQFITLFFEDQDVFEITYLIFVHFKGKENLDNWSQNILIERSEQVLNSRVCLKLFWPRN